MASVTLSSITKSFGETQVISGVDIAIADGEFAVFVGPSGCGKSTLLRMIAGLDAPDGGSIRIGEREVNGLPPKARGVSMVFQTYALYPHMTVQANMGFGLMIAGEAQTSIASKVAAAAKMLGLGELLARLPRQLSGGQRQRVAMGRAMVRDPQVFLFDEPLSNLDAKLRVQMRTEIRALHQRLKTTSIYVTHDQVEAMTMADRIVVLQGGKVEQAGTPVELYERPCNTFVAGFIGSPAMNLIAAKLIAIEGLSTLALTGFGAKIALNSGFEASAGTAVTLGLRPEHLRVAHRTAGEAVDGGIAATVRVVEFSGADTLLSCESEVGETTIQALIHDRTDLRPGDAVTLSIAPERVHVFDAATGLRL